MPHRKTTFVGMCENVNVLSPQNKTDLLKILTKQPHFFLSFFGGLFESQWQAFAPAGQLYPHLLFMFPNRCLCFCPLLLQRLQQRRPQSRRSRLTSALTKTISTTATTRTHSPTWMWRWPSFVSHSPPPDAARGACLRPLRC